MNGILLRTLITMLGLLIASSLVGGIAISGAGTFILAALLLGLVNAFVRPIAVLLTLPLTVLTLGLFLFIVNAAMFGLVAMMLDGFSVAGLPSAILGSIIVSVTSTISSWTIGPDGRYQIFILRRKS